MKRLVRLFAAVGALFATSCVTDATSDALVGGMEAKVTLSVEANAESSRAYSDGSQVNRLQYAVYETNEAGDPVKFIENGTADDRGVDGKWTIDLTLVTQSDYVMVFWADTNKDDAESCYTFTANENGAIVTANYNGVKANNENLDAFFGKKDFSVDGTTSVSATLKRPFAQVNFGANDYETADRKGFTVTKSMFETKVPTTLNLLSGEVGVYKETTFVSNAIPEGNVKANYRWVGMNYVLAPDVQTSLSVCKLTAYDNAGKYVEVEVPFAPVHRNWKTNLLGSILTTTAKVEVEITPGYTETAYVVDTDEALVAALNSGEENVYIYLNANLSYNEENNVGGETKNIYIYGALPTPTTQSRATDSRSTLTFNKSMKSAAKVVFNNMDMTGSDKVEFECGVELSNVTLDKTLSLKGAATLKDVVINQSNTADDCYALEIASNVNIDGLTIDSASCGIHITDAVTLDITNATFKTAQKGAIVVDSDEAVNITASNLDYTQTADTTDAVWVGEEIAKAGSDQVTVNGATKTVEGAVKVATWDEFTAALADDAYILLTADITYAGNYQLKKNVIVDLNGRSITMPMFYVFSTSTLKNGTINGKMYARTGCNVTLKGLTYSGTISDDLSTEGHLQVQGGCNVYAKDCTFAATTVNGSQTRSLSIEGSSSGTRKFEGCDFKFVSWGNGVGKYKKNVYVNTMSGTTTVEFTNCKLNGKAPNILFAGSYALTNLTMSGCDNTAPTLETNRAKDVITEAEWAHISNLIANNKFTQVRLFYAGGSSEYIR